MKTYIILFIFVVTYLGCSAAKQAKLEANTCSNYYDCFLERNIYTHYDEIPKYSRGNEGLLSIISKIDLPKEDEKQYRIILTFIIDEKGKLLKIGIKDKCISGYTSTERVIIDSLKNIEDWFPAKCEGNAIPVLFFYPITLNY